MTLQQLTYLVTVAECGNITDAAERLFLSQPSLSAAIHNLLIYELPDTVKQKVTEAEAYSTVWDIQMKLQHALPRSVALLWTGYAQGRRNPLR